MNKGEWAVVVGRRDQVEEIDFIQKLGYKVVLLNSVISMEDALNADLPVEVDLNDETEVLRKVSGLAERCRIGAVYTCNEYRLILGAKIAEALNLPHALSVEAARNCRSKARTRALLREHNVNPVAFKLVRSPAEALQALGGSEISLPVIVKPSNDAGSHMVRRCESLEEVWEAVEAIQSSGKNWVGQPLEADILIEEFIEGPEFSVECCTVNGITRVIAVTAKETAGMIETGHLVPAPLAEEDRQAIEALVTEALKVLGVDYIVSHTEVKLSAGGPKIIEVNARMGGDQIHRLVEAVTGYDLRKLAFHIAAGGTLEDAPRDLPAADSAQIAFLLAGQSGIVRLRSEAVSGMEGVQELKLLVEDGQHVKASHSNYNRLGYVIAHGREGKHASDRVRAAINALQLTVVAEQPPGGGQAGLSGQQPAVSCCKPGA
ncbi:ATP-grasp domain-containing protein [Paenibacillus tarimensis]|uniref:ATP-grasp domain-containing protein n=1 Tax=Paenibacillus tarimensis TaxID=416012 RepID=UPI001F43068E|nr:ATP-grasp domain-containing protein [Paenibacillus tarimensis]MCF2945275.1 ATP-grasp domain-containing protein [Paenibacillus tarimensis]